MACASVNGAAGDVGSDCAHNATPMRDVETKNAERRLVVLEHFTE